MVFSPALRRRLLRGMSCAAGGTAVLGLGQVAKLRWQYECPGEPVGQRHGNAGAAFQARKPLKLLFVGDSIAVGVGAKVAAPLQAACACRLASLQRRPVEWRTIAANGADVRELNELLEPGSNGDSQVVDLGFDIAVVLCGVNDGKKFWQGRWPSHFREDLAALCNKLRRAAPDGVITVPNLLGHVEASLFQLWPMCHLVDVLFDQFESQKMALAELGAVRCWLLEPGARKVLSTDQKLWSVDGIHPSTEGYHRIGEWLATHLAQMRPVPAIE